ncbi:molybdopterin biosynthesis protein moeX [Mycobacterium tuberculosis]|uniref:Molybdopterin biosynthesis protein moeX n=1 Tax=Mycobacterium tuberculosis TaxID=1773 RepID=A0A916LEC2_MYCTX|nr:molybdopterin biosynthesis protein moeX [Mycobacterium tuberculosis]COZ40012.1 molybdopterin biosynthesis protein moeX [Mycobacterium tuberculosis]
MAATDERALVTRTVEPLTPALDMVSRLFAEQWTRAAEEAALFPCA